MRLSATIGSAGRRAALADTDHPWLAGPEKVKIAVWAIVRAQIQNLAEKFDDDPLALDAIGF